MSRKHDWYDPDAPRRRRLRKQGWSMELLTNGKLFVEEALVGDGKKTSFELSFLPEGSIYVDNFTCQMLVGKRDSGPYGVEGTRVTFPIPIPADHLMTIFYNTARQPEQVQAKEGIA